MRGAATKAGQKKTNNFDACRDMSGRRLRHVNAEKRLEEWKAEAGERKLEKMAEEFLSKKEKELGKKRKTGKGEDAEKYVAKYREQSAKCMEDVERSVRESLKGVLAAKRKGRNGGDVEDDAEAKRRKIWMGKRVADSDSDDMDDDDSEDEEDKEKEKSAVIDNGNNSNSIKEANGSPDSITSAQLNSVSSEIVTSGSGSETEKCAGPEENPSSAQSTDDEDKTTPTLDVPSLDALVESGSASPSQENGIIDNFDNGQATVEKELVTSDLCEDSIALSHSKSACTETEDIKLEKPLNFDDYNSAAELEVLGMERLKSELQERGLKCGGTLQERAARLLLLKTTPLDKLPKKLFAKK